MELGNYNVIVVFIFYCYGGEYCFYSVLCEVEKLFDLGFCYIY